MSKVFEFLLLNRLKIWTKIRPEQHGFRAQHSTTTQLINVIDHLTNSANLRRKTVEALLDIEKAFDSLAQRNHLQAYPKQNSTPTYEHHRFLLNGQKIANENRGHHIKYQINKSWSTARIESLSSALRNIYKLTCRPPWHQDSPICGWHADIRDQHHKSMRGKKTSTTPRQISTLARRVEDLHKPTKNPNHTVLAQISPRYHSNHPPEPKVEMGTLC